MFFVACDYTSLSSGRKNANEAQQIELAIAWCAEAALKHQMKSAHTELVVEEIGRVRRFGSYVLSSLEFMVYLFKLRKLLSHI